MSDDRSLQFRSGRLCDSLARRQAVFFVCCRARDCNRSRLPKSRALSHTPPSASGDIQYMQSVRESVSQSVSRCTPLQLAQIAIVFLPAYAFKHPPAIANRAALSEDLLKALSLSPCVLSTVRPAERVLFVSIKRIFHPPLIKFQYLMLIPYRYT